MTIILVAYGSRGDVEPVLALTAGLRAAGHDARLAAPAPFEVMAAAHGVPFRLIEPDMSALAETELGEEWMDSGSRLQFLRVIRKVVDGAFDTVLSSVTKAVEGAAAVGFNRLGYAAWHCAEARGLPAFAVSAIPMAPTGAYPAVGLPELPLGPLSAPYNRWTWTAAEAMVLGRYAPRINDWRAAELGLPPVGRTGWVRRIGERGDPLLLSSSPTLLPEGADYPPYAHVTGYWVLPPADSWTPPPGLVDFLAAGPPPVAVTTGSLDGRRPAAVVDIVTGALADVGRRGVLVGGRALRENAAVSDDVFVLDSVPFGWLFPRAEAVVHHGGTGTIGHVLRARRPSVSLPLFGDQPFWGHRLAATGAAPPPISLKKVDRRSLAAALRVVLDDPSYAVAAHRVGAQLSAERGVDRAVELVERRLASPL